MSFGAVLPPPPALTAPLFIQRRRRQRLRTAHPMLVHQLTLPIRIGAPPRRVVPRLHALRGLPSTVVVSHTSILVESPITTRRLEKRHANAIAVHLSTCDKIPLSQVVP